jgi:hypothetical protein
MQGVVFGCLKVRSGQPAKSRLPESDLKLAAALAASSSLPAVQTTNQPSKHNFTKHQINTTTQSTNLNRTPINVLSQCPAPPKEAPPQPKP